MHDAIKTAVQAARSSISAMNIAPPGGLLSSKRAAREMAEAISGLENEVVRLEGEIVGEREARAKLDAALRQRDEAMGVLFDRLAKAGVDCSDLIS